MTPKNVGSVQLWVEIEIDIVFRSRDKERLSFSIVPEEQSNIELGLLSEKSPLAKAILGEKPGVTVPYFTQEIIAISILSVNESNRDLDSCTKKRRENFIKDTLSKIQFRDALLFASSTDTKWGSYDADGLDYSTWHNDVEDDVNSTNPNSYNPMDEK
jgi:hypothetical protein